MSGRARSWLSSGAVVGALIGVVALGWRDRARFVTLQPGDAAPAFELPTLSGDTVTLGQYHGRVILLNMWATWCAPCLWEMPAMEGVHQELAGNGLEVLAISLDAVSLGIESAESVDQRVRDFADKLGVGFTVLRDPSGVATKRKYNVDVLPTSFLIDRHGRVAHREIGAAQWDEEPYRSMIMELLEQ
jgi:peroxiredoxin